MILENAYYSVISPEGCAAILWKNSSAIPKAAESLRITADQLLSLKLVDDIIPEPLGGAQNDINIVSDSMRSAIQGSLKELLGMSKQKRLKHRYSRFRSFGRFVEG